MKLEIKYELRVEQDDLPVRGNALASGDAAEDKACEDEILARLDCGDTWAWAQVTVIARLIVNGEEVAEGRADLGGCSYKDETDFKSDDGYYADLCKEARTDLLEVLKSQVLQGEQAAMLLQDPRLVE